MEPPPNVLRADALRKGTVRGKIKTGAKTATKDQERDYLERFRRLADDPSPLVPRWAGEGADPFAKLRKRLARVQKRRDSVAWLKWLGRGRRMENAYAQTLIVLKGGKIPSFASLKFQGRDVKYILRGNGLRDKLVALQNHEDPSVRLLGYMDTARKEHLVVVSTDDEFFAAPQGTALPREALRGMLADEGITVVDVADGVRCAHADGSRQALRYAFPQISAVVTLCRACLGKIEGALPHVLERHILAPTGRFDMERTVTGTDLVVRPETARAELDRLVGEASREALETAKKFEGFDDVKYLDWAQEALQRKLDARPEGFLLVGTELWLGEFDAAADQYGTDDLSRRALKAAFRLSTPKIRAADPTLGRLLEPVWSTDARTLLEDLGAGTIDATVLDELARQRPAEAVAALDRALTTERRFAEYPRFAKLDAPVQLAHDLLKSHRTGDATRFARRLGEGVKDPQLKPLALALARAMGQSAGIEWQYAPHEKDQALYWEPFARIVVQSDPNTFEDALANLAEATKAAPPRRMV